jgi:hypothetical protein
VSAPLLPTRVRRGLFLYSRKDGGILNIAEVAQKIKDLISKYRNAYHPDPDESNKSFNVELESLLKEAVEEARFEADDKWRAKESECLVEARKTIAFLEIRIKEARAEAYRICAEMAETEWKKPFPPTNETSGELAALRIRDAIRAKARSGDEGTAAEEKA